MKYTAHRHAAALALLALAAQPHAQAQTQIYHCGGHTYQQTPCEGGSAGDARRITVSAGPTAAERKEAEARSRHMAKLGQRLEAERLARERKNPSPAAIALSRPSESAWTSPSKPEQDGKSNGRAGSDAAKVRVAAIPGERAAARPRR